MKIVIKQARVVDVYESTSKKGNNYGVLKLFVEPDSDIYDIFFFGNKLNQLKGVSKGDVIQNFAVDLVCNYKGDLSLKPL